MHTHTQTLFIVGKMGISGYDTGQIHSEGVTALQPGAAFPDLKPSRRQDKQPGRFGLRLRWVLDPRGIL